MRTKKPHITARPFSRRLIAVLIFSAVGIFTVNASRAHHSFAVHYVADQLITVSGTVTEFRFYNPHGVIFFTVTGANGEEQYWKAETNSPNVLKRRGWTAESIQAGQKITITGWPARNGSHLIRVSTVKFANGAVLPGQPAQAASGND
jgi:hypothetical protein